MQPVQLFINNLWSKISPKSEMLLAAATYILPPQHSLPHFFLSSKKKASDIFAKICCFYSLLYKTLNE